ncbi:MAG: aminotransferase class IV [Bacillota bacterium]
MPELWYLNGSVVPQEEARISVLDRGFLFGDGLYEVVRIYDNQPLYLEEHLDRFYFGVNGVSMPLPHTRDQFKDIIMGLIRQSNLGGASIYWEVSRGAYDPRTHYITDKMTKPSIFMQTRVLDAQPEEPHRVGTGAPLVQDIRWLKCCYKTVNLLANCMAMTVAHDAGVSEAVMYRDKDRVTECSASSFFIVKNGEIWTHPEGDLILSGITRLLLKRICEKSGIPFVERVYGLKDLFEADEAFFSNTILEVVPVVAVSGTVIGNGRPGPVTAKVIDLFLRYTGQK